MPPDNILTKTENTAIVQPVREEFSAGDSNVQKREGIRGLECHPP